MTSTELGIPERWIVWISDPVYKEWVALHSPFPAKESAIEMATQFIHRAVVVSTATGEVAWDSEVRTP